MKKKTASEMEKTRSAQISEKELDMPAPKEDDGIEAVIEREDVEKIGELIAAISAIFVAGPFSGVIVAGIAVTALFVPYLFPEDTFAPLSGRILELIGSEIEKAQRKSAIAQANARVSENVKLIDEVMNDFSIWEKTSDAGEKDRKKIRLQAHYVALTRDYGAKLTGDFTRADFGGALVSQYVSSASLYLPVLRSYHKYANELNLHIRRDNVDLQGSVLARLRKDIAEFTDTAVGLYNSGKNKIIEGGGKKQRTWDDFNDYRNTMTLTALDLLPAFAYLDPLLYPTGCHSRYLNRKLVTEFNTYKVKSDKPKRHDILRYDAYHYLVRGVTSLNSIRFFYGYFSTGSLFGRHDGLYATQCTILSTDGFETPRTLVATGNKNPESGLRHEHSISIGAGCFAIEGIYSTIKGYPPQFPSPYNAVGTIVSMKFIFGTPNDENYHTAIKLADVDITNPIYFPFSQSIPTIGNPPLLPSNFSERLVEFESIFRGHDKTFSYVLTWRHKTAVQNLLPKNNPVENAALNPIEQFHAIRAATSVWDKDGKVVPGPGFTGGDLVKVAYRESFSFYLARDPQRWFGGLYHVRLYFVNKAPVGQLVTCSVGITPAGNFAPSGLTGSFRSEAVSDLKNLKFNDLLSFTFSGTVLLAAAMPGFTLTFTNTSLSGEIVVDRIELIFQRAASLNDVAA